MEKGGDWTDTRNSLSQVDPVRRTAAVPVLARRWRSRQVVPPNSPGRVDSEDAPKAGQKTDLTPVPKRRVIPSGR